MILVHLMLAASFPVGKGFTESVFNDGKCLGLFAFVRVRKFSNSICLFGRTKNIIAGSSLIGIVFSSCIWCWNPGIRVASISSSIRNIDGSSWYVVYRIRIATGAIRITTINRARATSIKIRMVYCNHIGRVHNCSYIAFTRFFTPAFNIKTENKSILSDGIITEGQLCNNQQQMHLSSTS